MPLAGRIDEGGAALGVLGVYVDRPATDQRAEVSGPTLRRCLVELDNELLRGVDKVRPAARMDVETPTPALLFWSGLARCTVVKHNFAYVLQAQEQVRTHLFIRMTFFILLIAPFIPC